MAYGQRSPIGSMWLFKKRCLETQLKILARQERLLQGLMREIVRMTAQKQPLEVGVPLYPFSHTTLFRKDEASAATSDEPVGIAPLPHSPPYENARVTSPVASGITPSSARTMPASSWPIQDLPLPSTSVERTALTNGTSFSG